MRIAINTRLLLPHKLDGIGWFTAETLRRIVKEHPEHDFYFFFDRRPDPQFIYASNVRPVVIFPQARHPFLWFLFFEFGVTRALRHYDIDLFLSTDGWMSLRTSVPTLTVIHDLNFEHSNDFLRPSHQRYMKHFFPRFAVKATRIATVSEFSKQDIVETYKVRPEKIDVVYDGAHNFYRKCSEEEIVSIRQHYAEGKPYFIYVGTISRRKNLTNILLAFDKYKAEHQSNDVKLLVVGSRYWWQDELADAYNNMQYQSDVIFIGHIDSDVLAQLMSASLALVYTSLFEGFGIPIIEAFCAETAVITSNVTSMPEVAGDAALLVDPLSVDAISKAMSDISDNEGLRSSLIEKGKARKDIFTWERTSKLLWDSLMKVK